MTRTFNYLSSKKWRTCSNDDEVESILDFEDSETDSAVERANPGLIADFNAGLLENDSVSTIDTAEAFGEPGIVLTRREKRE